MTRSETPEICRNKGEGDALPAVTVKDRIADHYTGLSTALRGAADYIAAHPVDVATRSLRSVSASSGVSPATFSRLARALGFENYEQLRDLSRGAVGRPVISFSEKAGQLQADARANVSIFERQMQACAANILDLSENTDNARLEAAVEVLRNARNVILVGAFGSTGIVEYMAYLANYFSDNWTLAGRMGASLGSVLAPIGPEDALLIVTKTPYAKRAVLATEIAHRQGAKTVLLTDSHACPAIPNATVSFIVPSDSPQFFSSYAATLVLMEAIIAMLVSRSEVGTGERIREVEKRNKALGEFWSD